MRLWHHKLLRYLPEAQFKGQLREMVAIMRDWRDRGTTNHLLINKVMEYDKTVLKGYYQAWTAAYWLRYGQPYTKYDDEFREFAGEKWSQWGYSQGWHNKEYLRVCMANLYEKHFFGIGKSRITDEEWQVLLDGYKAITGEEYKI